MNNRVRHRRIKRKGRLRHQNNLKKLGICAGLCLFVAIIFHTAATAEDTEKALITLKAESAEIMQNEKLPAFKVKASVKGDKSIVLDEKSGYTVQNLLDDFNSGRKYKVSCEADGKLDGEFPIQLKLEKKLADSLMRDWFGKIDVKIKNGTFVVKNKYGQWDGNKFKKTNGEYAKNEFISSKGNTYYFGEEGKMQTGWQEKDGLRYYFNKAGVMQTGWQEKDGTKLYLKENGSVAVGWTKIGKDKYYFDADGKKLTGEQQIGTKKCKFAKDGKLLSEEYSLDLNKPMVALTFDDGPGPGTKRILKVLEENGARATFFMLGPKAKKYPDTVKMMQEIGCELGNHTTHHKQLTKLTPEEIKKEVGTTSAVVSKATGGFVPSVMRPPYGAINAKVKQNVGLPLIMWSLDTLDWKTRNVNSNIKAVMKARDGDIILMHDIHKESVEAAEELIPKLISKGYQLVTVSELAEARGKSVKNGVRYSQFYK